MTYARHGPPWTWTWYYTDIIQIVSFRLCASEYVPTWRAAQRDQSSSCCLRMLLLLQSSCCMRSSRDNACLHEET